MRPNLPNHRPLLLISAGTGLTLMVWQTAWDRASSGRALIPFLGWLTILLTALPIVGLTLRAVIFDRRTGRFWDGVHQDGDPMTDLKMEVLRRQMF